ncbi:MAG TPA: hypothetical protein VH252_00950 [Chthoniobacterales bacterium]|jgi:hypothetical protein|nr:hypothetical protein [Chthoniobacterales bacterium]
MTNPPKAKRVHQESTYQMLVESEEKERTVIEDIVYLLLVVATTTAIWQFSQQPVTFADLGAIQTQTAVELGS